MSGSKNSNANRGDKQVEGKNAFRKRVLVVSPSKRDPKKLKSRFRWADELS